MLVLLGILKQQYNLLRIIEVMTINLFILDVDNIHLELDLTAGWSSGLRSRLRGQRSRVRVPVGADGFVMNKIICLRVMAVYMYIYRYILYKFMYSIRYLVSITTRS